MNALNTKAIVLNRVNYGEADRIITFITPDHGKITLIAKAVRKPKSKLAGGIELFSISEVSFIEGRRDVGTLISSRLLSHYGNIVKELKRTDVAYSCISKVNKTTEDKPESAYFKLLSTALDALNNLESDAQLVGLWFDMQLLKLAGYQPNLKTDTAGNNLSADKAYDFHLDEMAFALPASRQGNFNSDHIKFLRVGFSASNSSVLARITKVDELTSATQPLVQGMLRNYIKV